MILPNLAFSAGIPVVDATANSQMATQNAKEVAEWTKQATRWQDTVNTINNKFKLIKMNLCLKQVQEMSLLL
ncbi:hypothetical protein L8V92_07835 [Campylobacter lari]|nr:hypothetical protein [Campylobacter lari]